MRIGIVCPYSFDAPGGVQFHIRDMAEELERRGHYVRVLAPSTQEETPHWLDSVGGSFAVPFNGSVARLAFGPRVSRKTKKWLEEGDFDVLHIHEPGTPSVGMLALFKADVPVVATFHSAMEKSKLRSLTAGMIAPVLEKISARIAVSEEAKRTLLEHHGGNAIVIPNGVFTKAYLEAEPIGAWEAKDDAPVIVFLGRLDESRKGLPVFAGAIPKVLEKHPGARFLIAGRGEADALKPVLEAHPDSVEVLGEISESEKESLLKGATVYVAPQLGGESFGIVLVEAMAAGTHVIASDIPAFEAVLDGGAAGDLFKSGDSNSLAAAINEAIEDPERSAEIAAKGNKRAEIYDWGSVTDRVMDVYEAVVPWGPRPSTGTPYENLQERFGSSSD